jgi:hypothetical protein
MNVCAHVTLADKRAALDKLGRCSRRARIDSTLSPAAVSRVMFGSAASMARLRKLRTVGQRAAAGGSVLRACRDSNPKPSDP